MKRTAIFLMSGLVMALLLAACGSDDPEPPTGVDSPAPPEAASAGRSSRPTLPWSDLRNGRPGGQLRRQVGVGSGEGGATLALCSGKTGNGKVQRP